MSHPDRNEILQDLLDGLLDPQEEARIHRRIAEEEDWGRAYRQAMAVRTLLGTPLDVDPPVDLVPVVLARIAADRERRAARFRLPAFLENLLVISGAGALAALVAVVSQAAGAGGAGWLGPLTIVSTRFVTRGAEVLAEVASSLARLDWAARLLATLSEAFRTVLATTAPPLLAVTLVAFTCTLVLAWVLVRGKAREGALSHVHVAI